MVWISFGALPCRGEKKPLMTARGSMLLKSRASLTCFRACFIPGRAKDLSAPRYVVLMQFFYSTATDCDSLRAAQSGDRIPVRVRFSAPVQTCPGAHPASYTTGTGSFPGVKRPGRGVDHPPTSSTQVKERVELHPYSPSWPSWSVI